LAIEGTGLGIDGIEGDELDVEQGVDEGAVFGFQGDGDGAAAEALAQTADPVLEGLGRMRQVEFFDGGETLNLECQGVSLIAPIQADKSSVVSHDHFQLFFGA